MPPQFTYSRRVHFSDTDLAGIVHFANFYRFMEEAEHEYFRSLGLKLMEHRPDGTAVGWPRVRASCNFQAPALYDDLIEIDVRVARLGVKSLTLSFHFRRGDQQIATGELKTVFCHCERGGKIKSIEIPEEWREKLATEETANDEE